MQKGCSRAAEANAARGPCRRSRSPFDPAALTFAWSTLTGSLSNETQNGEVATAEFTCPATLGKPTAIPVAVLLNDGTHAGCNTTDSTATITVTCPAGSP